MDERDQPLPADMTADGAESAADLSGAGNDAAPTEEKKRTARAPRPRRPRKKAEAAAPEAPGPEVIAESAPDAPPAAPPLPDEALVTGADLSPGVDFPSPDELAEAGTEIVPQAPVGLQAAEQAVVDAGEPIPLFPRDLTLNGPRREVPELVLVPEAEAVLGPDGVEEPEPLFAARARAETPGLPPITPELLAEVRGVSPDEVLREGEAPPAREGRDRRRRGRKGEAPEAVPPTPAAAPAPPPTPAGPAFILVPEALLQAAPDEVIEEEAITLPAALPDEAEAPGRRGRRRGRDRRRGEGEAPAATTPSRAEAPEEAGRDRRDRERERAPAEPRAEREHKEILINVDPRETRIAVLEAGRLVELHVEREERVVGSVFKGRVSNVLPGMDCAFVDIGLDRNAFLYVGDILFEDTRGDRDPVRRTSRDVRIQDLVKPGQEILVQVTKGPRGTKGARVSTKISIPGRYLVLMPDADNLGVSRKVEDARERDRLKRIVEQFKPKGFGLIVRTEAEDRTEQELKQDLDYLLKAWGTIQEKNKKIHHPAVIHKDLGVILKTIRDLFGTDVDKLVLDDAEEYEKVEDVLGQLAPDLLERVELYDEREPLFIRYNLEEEIERLLKRKVWLRNGAYLLVDTTEALTTIDVNTGKFVGTSSLAETILKTNLDAVDEIARQLRLRDIGGMIVLDFIDMASSRDRALVMRALENAFKKDRTRIKIAHISPLGLVEMTRKRTAEAVTDVMSHVCPYCTGRGRVWSPETMAIQIEREIRRKCANEDVDAILVHCSPEVAEQLIGPEGESVERMERLLRRPVYIRARHDHHIEKWEILSGDMLEMEEQMMPFHGGQIVECQVAKSDLITPPRSAAWADGYFVDLANGTRFQGQTIRVRLTDVRRSFALGDPIAPSTSVDRSEPI